MTRSCIFGKGRHRQLDELHGKRVNIGEATPAPISPPPILLGLRGIEVVESLVSHDAALARLEASELDAMFVVAGKPAQLLSAISRERIEAADLRFVPIEPVPTPRPMVPHADGCGLSQPGPLGRCRDHSALGGQWPSISSPEQLAASTDRKFTRRLFENFDQLQAPMAGFHEKWQEVNLTSSSQLDPAADRGGAGGGETAGPGLPDFVREHLRQQGEDLDA
jgi:hypothetical protein